MCRLYASISPHNAQVPTSIWNLPFRVWVGIAADVDDYLEQLSKANRK